MEQFAYGIQLLIGWFFPVYVSALLFEFMYVKILTFVILQLMFQWGGLTIILSFYRKQMDLLILIQIIFSFYRLENTLNYGLERVWAVGYIKGSRR